jgi:epoxyqueuosine reductase
MMNLSLPTDLVKLQAWLSPGASFTKLGFTNESSPVSYSNYKDWVQSNGHGPLGYLADHRGPMRSDVKNYYPDFQQALVFLFSYSETRGALEKLYKDEQWNGLKIASYALGFEGVDYHHLLRLELLSHLDRLKSQDPELDGVLALDVHPVLDRDLAYRAGLGWFGKNSMLINREVGSFVMIGSLLLNKPVVSGEPRALELDHCGHCRACIDRCPTDAIDESSRTITSSKCISTFTIELNHDTPAIPGHVEQGSGEIFGCDLCQDVCPWNKKPLGGGAEKTSIAAELSGRKQVQFFLLRPVSEILRELESMSERGYRKLFQSTVFERLGLRGMKKNLRLFK